MINSVFLNFFSLHTALDDKGEAASETSLRLGPAGQTIWREVWQQPAAAGGRWKGTAPHWPQHGWQELQQEEHLQPAQVKQRTLTHSHHTRTWLSGPPLSHFLGMCGHRRRCNSASLQVRISGLWVRMKTDDGGAIQMPTTHHITWVCWTEGSSSTKNENSSLTYSEFLSPGNISGAAFIPSLTSRSWELVLKCR